MHRRPPDQPRRKKKKANRKEPIEELLQQFPYLLEINPDGSDARRARRFPLSVANTEIGCERNVGNQYITIYGPDIYPRHCVVSHQPDGMMTVSPAQPEAVTLVNGQRIDRPLVLRPGMMLQLGKGHFFRFCAPMPPDAAVSELSASVLIITLCSIAEAGSRSRT
ncbi:hypothetical protein CAPTEDRAFT_144984 [Capitella teleta]|uniref:FHA domain-containing protein n=1 Tax=Capitella teleta TaxID=283909 RepID=R7U1A7_CAPTE|nr:hypothetical protein CAPTEDRAFT_144984 [Capitella teleta]|eukprot:ELT96970.1 hypothetical protein CAPTEDRAFT_144984 [Capitella teleta]